MVAKWKGSRYHRPWWTCLGRKHPEATNPIEIYKRRSAKKLLDRKLRQLLHITHHASLTSHHITHISHHHITHHISPHRSHHSHRKVRGFYSEEVLGPDTSTRSTKIHSFPNRQIVRVVVDRSDTGQKQPEVLGPEAPKPKEFYDRRSAKKFLGRKLRELWHITHHTSLTSHITISLITSHHITQITHIEKYVGSIAKKFSGPTPVREVPKYSSGQVRYGSETAQSSWAGSCKTQRILRKTLSKEVLGPEATWIMTHHTSHITHISHHHITHHISPHHSNHSHRKVRGFYSEEILGPDTSTRSTKIHSFPNRQIVRVVVDRSDTGQKQPEVLGPEAPKPKEFYDRPSAKKFLGRKLRELWHITHHTSLTSHHITHTSLTSHSTTSLITSHHITQITHIEKCVASRKNA